MGNGTASNKQGFFKNDRMFVCSMLVFYGLCTIGLIALLFWGWDRRNQTLSANATATGAVIATQNANATATAVARREEQDLYAFIERFDIVSGRWLGGFVDSEYWVGRRNIQNGTYIWQVKEVKKTFVTWATFYKGNSLEDFDVYVDTRMLDAEPGDVCSGFMFRISPDGSDEGHYYYVLCNNSLVVISYYNEQDGWERIGSVPYYGYSQDWNRLEIQARGSHFSFFINGEQVYDIDDDRQPLGGIALAIELNEKVPATVEFDNFGYQSR